MNMSWIQSCPPLTSALFIHSFTSHIRACCCIYYSVIMAFVIPTKLATHWYSSLWRSNSEGTYPFVTYNTKSSKFFLHAVIIKWARQFIKPSIIHYLSPLIFCRVMGGGGVQVCSYLRGGVHAGQSNNQISFWVCQIFNYEKGNQETHVARWDKKEDGFIMTQHFLIQSDVLWFSVCP